MGEVAPLNGTIALDSSPLIYFVERNPRYVDLVRTILQDLNHRGVPLVTSTVTLAEVLVQPIRADRESLSISHERHPPPATAKPPGARS